MNTAQRKFLIEKITEKAKARIRALEQSKETAPSASNYIFKAILNGKLKLQPDEITLKAIEQKAIKAKEGDNWLSEERNWSASGNFIKLNLTDLLVVPEDYFIELEKVKAHNQAINKEIAELQMQLDTMEVRIQLASDKNLQSLINDIDDMGDVKLVDSHLKLLNK